MGARFVSWNCRGAFHNKAAHIIALDPDIAVISEVTENAVATLGDCTKLWIGGKSGIAVIARNGWTIDDSGVRISETWFLPVTVHRGDDRVKLLAAWVVPSKKNGAYVPPTLSAVTQLREFLTGEDTLFMGDLNQNVIFDLGRSEARRFQTVLDDLGKLGLASLWHGFSHEAHGRERSPTYYHHFVREKPFHIDYAFGSASLAKRVGNVVIGRYDDWVANRLSDHVPVVVDIR
jgi:hypothetical protein